MLNEPSVVSFPFKNQDDKNNDDHLAVLKELENIDDECDRNEIAFVKISNLDEAKEYGLDVLPALVYFENRIPSIYEGVGRLCFMTRAWLNVSFHISGNLSEEEEVLSWLVEQKSSDTIEELTDELLENIIKENEYVVVYFSAY